MKKGYKDNSCNLLGVLILKEIKKLKHTMRFSKSIHNTISIKRMERKTSVTINDVVITVLGNTVANTFLASYECNGQTIKEPCTKEWFDLVEVETIKNKYGIRGTKDFGDNAVKTKVKEIILLKIKDPLFDRTLWKEGEEFVPPPFRLAMSFNNAAGHHTNDDDNVWHRLSLFTYHSKFVNK